VLRELQPLPDSTRVVLTSGFDPRDLDGDDELSQIPMLHKPYDLARLERLLAAPSRRSASPLATGNAAAPAP
jgi:hypothetical protein